MLTFRSSFVPLAVVLGLTALAPDARALSGAVRVVDGDTLELGGQTVRLFGIDAPEHDQSCDRGGEVWSCGDWSTAQLRALVAGHQVTCEGEDRDRYGRVLARCQAGGQDLGAAMVEAGAARAYRRYSNLYAGVERTAQTDARGIWSGRMEEPEAFRRDRVPAVADPAPGCAIKGNISANGHIYHLPGQESYADTRINPARGEAWFCSEAEARAAGFRPAAR